MTTSARLAAAMARGERLFRAPGRVNIIGEHTDYCDGLVLPANTGLYTWVAAKPRKDRNVHVTARVIGESSSFSLDDIEPDTAPGWIDYVKGVARELEEEGARLVGAEISIDGDIPIGGGLSSSASLELALANAFLGLADQAMQAPAVASACQRAERRYAAVNCGIMDQFSVACGIRGHAMLLDCRTLETDFVPIPDELALVVTDCGVKHELPDSDYNDRHEECQQAVQILKDLDPSVENLRDATRELLQSSKPALGDTLLRRSRHVVSEIGRVRETFAALRNNDLESVGRLVQASHASLRDDFAVSCEEIETLVGIADACEGVLGSRMVGGGFGGCVLSIARKGDEQRIMEHIANAYGGVLGRTPWIHVVTPASPAGEVTAI